MVKDLCFEIIEACPNECKFCSSNSCIDKKQIILFDDFKRVIDYFMSKGGIEELSLSGGEPFLHPDLFKMIEYVKSLGIRTVIFTSGIKRRLQVDDNMKLFYINEMNKRLKDIEECEPWNHRLKDNIKKYYDRLINPEPFNCITLEELSRLRNIGLDKIVFDFQSYEHETDEFLMGHNRQKHLCLLDSLLNTSNSGIETDVHFIPMKPNYREIKDLLELLELAQIKNISILKFVPQGRGLINKDKLMLSDDELLTFMNILNESRHVFSGNIRIGIPLMGNNTHKCNAGLEKLDIKFDGTILPCPAFKELSLEIMKKHGIKYYNIYENLEEVNTPGGKRVEPLCEKVYKKE